MNIEVENVLMVAIFETDGIAATLSQKGLLGWRVVKVAPFHAWQSFPAGDRPVVIHVWQPTEEWD